MSPARLNAKLTVAGFVEQLSQAGKSALKAKAEETTPAPAALSGLITTLSQCSKVLKDSLGVEEARAAPKKKKAKEVTKPKQDAANLCWSNDEEEAEAQAITPTADPPVYEKENNLIRIANSLIENASNITNMVVGKNRGEARTERATPGASDQYQLFGQSYVIEAPLKASAK